MRVDNFTAKFMLFLIFLMASYFIGINFLDNINDKNENNAYVSLNLVFNTKEDYIEEYIKYIQEKKYSLAYSMLCDESKAKFSNSESKFKQYVIKKYESIDTEMWKFNIKLLSEQNLKSKNIFAYEVLDPENEDAVLIKKITVYEYAANVFKIYINE